MSSGTVAELERARRSSQNPRRILVVDDDQAQVWALQHRLQRLGYQAVAAHTGSEALAIAAVQRLDLVILDLRLPDANGLEVCAELADSPNTSQVPIIILSAMERPDIVRRARSAGCGYYVRKPYDPNVLLALIENSLGTVGEPS